MEQLRTIVHVATGSREWERAADEALAGVSPICRLDDPFSAVVFISRNRANSPIAMLIGLDELDPDERRLAAYARQTWPNTPILVYGSRVDATGVPREATSIVVDPRKLPSAFRSILDAARPTSNSGNGDTRNAQSRDVADPRRRAPLDSAILSTEELASLLGERDL